MSINNITNSAKNSKDSNQKNISEDQLLEYIHLYREHDNAPVRVFAMDGGISPAGRDGFVYMDRSHFKVRWHSGGDDYYILKQNDIIGIESGDMISYETRRLVVNSEEK